MTKEELRAAAEQHFSGATVVNRALSADPVVDRTPQNEVEIFDPQTLGLDAGLPFSVQRRIYVQTLDRLHSQRLAWLEEQCEHVRGTARVLNRAALEQVSSIATTAIQKTLAFEEVERSSTKTRAILEIWHDWNRNQKEIMAQAGIWPDHLVLQVYKTTYDLCQAAAAKVAEMSVSLDAVAFREGVAS